MPRTTADTATAITVPEAHAVEPSGALVDLAADLAAAVRFHHAGGLRESSQRARATDWRIFTAWCDARGALPLPADPGTVAAFAAGQADGGKAPATVRRYVASIASVHREAGHDSPCSADGVRRVLRGIAETINPTAAPAVKGKRGQAAPILAADVRAMIEATPGDELGAVRDRALLLLGYAGGFRRSELAGLTLEALTIETRGVVVRLGRTKTTTAEEGREVSIARGHVADTCPVRALRAWLDGAGITSGPVFRPVGRWGTTAPRAMTDRAVADAVKAAAVRAGLDPSHYSAHSLRAGHVTQRRAAGDDVSSIQDATGHRSERMVRRYDRGARRFRGDVSRSLGL